MKWRYPVPKRQRLPFNIQNDDEDDPCLDACPHCNENAEDCDCPTAICEHCGFRHKIPEAELEADATTCPICSRESFGSFDGSDW
jgi:hypothetical protein